MQDKNFISVVCRLLVAQVDLKKLSSKMTFWQENYSFIKEVYDTRYAKMVEWMDNVEMAIQKVCASRVYTSAEFKREKDNFHVGKDIRILFDSVSLKYFKMLALFFIVFTSRFLYISVFNSLLRGFSSLSYHIPRVTYTQSTNLYTAYIAHVIRMSYNMSNVNGPLVWCHFFSKPFP